MTSSEKDFDVQVRVRNGRLLRAIQKHYASSAEFCRKFNLNPNSVSGLVSMRMKPINEDGWTQLASDVALVLGKDPEDLWPDHIKEIKLRRSTASFGADYDEVLQITQQGSLEKIVGQRQTLELLTEGLTDREKYCLKAHYEEERTLDEIAEVLGRSRERVRQIIAKAIRKSRKVAQANGLMVQGSRSSEILYNKETCCYEFTTISTPHVMCASGLELLKDDELS